MGCRVTGSTETLRQVSMSQCLEGDLFSITASTFLSRDGDRRLGKATQQPMLKEEKKATQQPLRRSLWKQIAFGSCRTDHAHSRLQHVVYLLSGCHSSNGHGRKQSKLAWAHETPFSPCRQFDAPWWKFFQLCFQSDSITNSPAAKDITRSTAVIFFVRARESFRTLIWPRIMLLVWLLQDHLPAADFLPEGRTVLLPRGPRRPHPHRAPMSCA